MKKIYYLPILLILIVLSTTGCKKENKSEENEEPEAVAKVYDRGTPEGVAVQKAIGPAGGTIATDDGRISITVPAGTVSSETTFSIQPISNTLPLGSGLAYRLLPENVTFSKPVTITFNFTDASLGGTAASALYLAYQNQQGYWKVMKNTTVDITNQTLSVQSTHFSDWGIIEEVRVEADKDTLAVNEATRLVISRIELTNDDVLAPLVPTIENVKPSDISWRIVEGEGTLTPFGSPDRTDIYAYKAPATAPSRNPVLIETSIKNLPIAGKAGRPAQLLILTPIRVISNHMKVSFGGVNAFIENVSIITNGASTIITGQLSSGFSVTLFCNGSGARSFSYGDVNIAGNGSITTRTTTGNQFVTNYSNCTTNQPTYSSGSIVISQWGEIGQIIKGSFSGTVYRALGCPQEPESRTITGEFAVIRQF